MSSYKTITVDGGLDTVTDKITVAPGTIQDCENFEVGTTKGLTRIDGFERYDGRVSPSSLSNFRVIRSLQTNLSGTFAYGAAVTWSNPAGADLGPRSGTILYMLLNDPFVYIGLSNIEGPTPLTGDTIDDGGGNTLLLVDGEWVTYDFTNTNPYIYYQCSAPIDDWSALGIGPVHWPTADPLTAEGTGVMVRLYDSGPTGETLNFTLEDVNGRPPELGDQIYDVGDFLLLDVTTNFTIQEFNSSQQAALNDFISQAALQYRDEVLQVPGAELTRIPGAFVLNDRLYVVVDYRTFSFTDGFSDGAPPVEGWQIDNDSPSEMGTLVSVNVTSGDWVNGSAAGTMTLIQSDPSANATVGSDITHVGTGSNVVTYSAEAASDAAGLWYCDHNGAGGWNPVLLPRQIGYKQQVGPPLTDPAVFFLPYQRPGLSADLLNPDDTGVTDPITGSAFSNPALNWTSPGDAELNDGVYTSSAVSSVVRQTGELAVLFNFSNLVPTASVILGIQVTIKRYYAESVPSAGQVFDQEVTLLGIAGAVQNKADLVNPWPLGVGAVATATYGGPADNWGGAITVSEVRDPTKFGVKLRAQVINPTVAVNYNPAVDVITCQVYYKPQTSKVFIWDGTSDIEATVIHRVVESGTPSGNDAEGVAFLTGVGTDAEKSRLIGAGEEMRTDPMGGGSLIAMTTSSDTPVTLPSSYQVIEADTRYVSETASPYVGVSNEVVLGANGVGRGFLFDGTNLVPLGSGLTRELETPTQVAFTGAQAALGYPNSSVEISELGNPALLGTAVNGSVSLQFQGPVSGLQRLVGDALGVWTRGNIQTWDLVNAAQRTVSAQSGAIPYTVCDMGQPMFADFRGIGSISAVLGYGDFQRGKYSQLINPVLIDRLQSDQQTQDEDRRALASYSVRNKNQYRLIFRDGYQITGTFINDGLPQFTWQRFYVDDSEDSDKQIQFLATCYGTTSGGKDLQFFSIANQPDYNRYVFRMDSGRTFDGTAIKAWFTLNPLIFGYPSSQKEWVQLNAYGTAYGFATINTHLTTDFRVATESSPGASYPFGSNIAPSTSALVPVRNTMTMTAAGSGMDCTIRIQSENAVEGPYTIQAFHIKYNDQDLDKRS